jgi:predicted MFS family arabinose efflux permease
LVEDKGQLKSFKDNLNDTFKLLISVKMRRLIPGMIWCSLSLATFAGSFVTIMTDTIDSKLSENEKLELSLFAMIPLGIGQMIGGAIIGQIIDRKGLKLALLISATLMTLAFGIMLWYIWSYEFGWITYVVTFVWGLQDSSINNIMNCSLGFEFDSVDKTLPFSVQNFMQPLFTFIFMVVQA